MKKCIFLAFMLFTVLQTVRAAPFDLREAIKQARIGDEMIKTVKGKYTYGDGETESAVSYTYDHRSGKLLTRIHEKRETDTLDYIKLYDGQSTTTYTLLEENNEPIYQKAVINNESGNKGMFTPFIYSYFISRRGIADILGTGTMIMPGSAEKITGLKFTGNDTVNNLDVAVFSATHENGAVVTLYLCPDYFYRPIKYVAINQNGVTQSIITSTYNEIKNGLHFPKEVNVVHFRERAITMHYAHNETQINPPLTDDDFTIDIPDDVTVNDDR